MPLTQQQRDYLAGAPPSAPGIEELVRLGHNNTIISQFGGRTWRDYYKTMLEAQYKFRGEWLDTPGVQGVLANLPLKPAFKVYLEKSVLWLKAWTQPVGMGGGFQVVTRILVLRPNMDTNGTFYEIGHVGYQGWLYQKPELQAEFVLALKEYVNLGLEARKGFAYTLFPSLEYGRVWRLIWGYLNRWWKEDGEWWDGMPTNYDELYASTFSACLGDLALLPPFINVFYRGMVGQTTAS